MENQDELKDILARLDLLLKNQANLTEEVSKLQRQVDRLRWRNSAQIESPSENTSELEPTPSIPKSIGPTHPATAEKTQTQSPTKRPLTPKKEPRFKLKSDLEKFIGENLINKIGIVILIIGVSIGAKYAIDHDLISPLTRIILGYATGLALLLVGMRLRQNYEAYSAVLVSGAMAIMYFITYAAFSFYQLIPEVAAFGLMVLFTVFTVIAALRYNQQVIALIGLVGAYAVPFLLSSEEGSSLVLLTYMAIINIGILFIAVHKYWKPLYYSSFILTWVIFIWWYNEGYQIDQHFGLALAFAFVLFLTFYMTFLAYKLHKKELFNRMDILLLLANSFVFYGIGYSLLDQHQNGAELLGLFTLSNALIHFIISAIVYRQKLADRKLFYFVAGLVLVFLTIAIPVQLDGHWVTMLWAGEAALLFWIGRTKQVRTYERISYGLMFLAFFSMTEDWQSATYVYDALNPNARVSPILNRTFLTAVLAIASFGLINYVHWKNPAIIPKKPKFGLTKIMTFFIPAIFLFIIYNTFKVEISTYFHQLYMDANAAANFNADVDTTFRPNFMLTIGDIYSSLYAMFFLLLLSWVNLSYIKSRTLGFISLGLSILAIFLFLTNGLAMLGELRANSTLPSSDDTVAFGLYNHVVRYIGFALIGALLWVVHRYLLERFMFSKSSLLYDLVLHSCILWMASDELIHWMQLAGSDQAYQLGLSILWGVYALFLIILGIQAKKKHLRIMAIVLFGATLIKLFFYDLSSLSTISKTIVMVSLGVLLLIISFLYNKYKHLIADETND
jgi:uncharacterized membrane protein